MIAVCEMPRTFFDYSSAKVINITETCKRLTVFLQIFFLTSCVGNAMSKKVRVVFVCSDFYYYFCARNTFFYEDN